MNTIPCPLHLNSQKNPGIAALICPRMTLTYARLNHLVRLTEKRLKREQFRSGQRIAIYSQNSIDVVIVILALNRLGAITCLLNARLPALSAVAQLDQIDADVLLTSVPEKTKLGKIKIPCRLFSDFIDYDLRNSDGVTDDELVDYAPDQPATIIFTSGSTGSAKAVLHTHGSQWFSADGCNRNIKIGPGDRWLLSLPLYHVGGLAIIYRCLSAAGTIVLPDNQRPMPEIIINYRISHISLVPTQLRRLLREDLLPLLDDQLKAVLIGGDIIRPDLIAESINAGLPVHTTYGLTEMGSQVTTTPPEFNIEKRLTAGRLLAHRELKIAADGEILVKGKTLFAGYFEAGKLSIATDDHGWFHSEDIGSIDHDGYLSILGRQDYMFISGGENIYPEEIESALTSSDTIMHAIVVPIADNEFGYRPTAFVKVRDNRSLESMSINDTLATQLPRYKLPVIYRVWPDDVVPENTGSIRKVLQRLLLESPATGTSSLPGSQKI